MKLSLDDKGPLGEFVHRFKAGLGPAEFIEIHSSRPFALTEFWVTLRDRVPARYETLRIESGLALELEVTLSQVGKRPLWAANLFFSGTLPVRLFLVNVEHEVEVGGHWEAIEP